MLRPLKPYQIVVDVVAAGLFAALAAPLELQQGRILDANALGTALVTVLLAAALAVRRLSPGISLALAWTGATVQMAFGRDPGVVDLAIFAVLYATAAYGSRLVFWLGFVSAIVGAGVITAYLFLGRSPVSGFDWSTITTAAAVLIAATFALLLAWTVGALVRTGIRARENRAAQQRAEQETLAEQERVRIARDMHDVVAHSLAVVVAQADGARYAAADDPALATHALATISSTARSALADVRLLLTQLRHSQGDGPQPTLVDLEVLFAQVREAGVDLRVDVDPAPPSDVPAAVQLAVFRILQEALTNALRHGDGGTVSLGVSWREDRVELSVRNRVRTGDAPRAGHGVIGMRERAQLAGGTLSAEAVDGSFLLRVTLPLGGAS